jgi:RNA polymerase sigma-70 factor (ECF subfamily)
MITNLYAGPASRSYFTRFEAMPFPRSLVLGWLDGERVLVLLGGLAPDMAPTVVVRLEADRAGVRLIRHYTGCPWILAAALSLTVEAGAPSTTLH